MRYGLWSRGRLLGYTELDIPCVQSFIRQGFIESTDIGETLLEDATAVAAVCTALDREKRRADGRLDETARLEAFRRASDRREALKLELRDENGGRVAAEWIQVNDLQFDPYAEDDGDWCPDSDDEIDFEEELEDEFAADVETFDLHSKEVEWQDEPDPRWETMRYHIMVRLPGARDRS